MRPLKDLSQILRFRFFGNKVIIEGLKVAKSFIIDQEILLQATYLTILGGLLLIIDFDEDWLRIFLWWAEKGIWICSGSLIIILLDVHFDLLEKSWSIIYM